MIPFFPTPYPDELWYSVICRYHIRSGNPSVKYSIRELYGANHINVPVELCGALSSLLEAIPAKALTAKDIIMQHTLYPYYHNKRFKSMAEAHGLEVEHHPKYGWTITSPGVDLLDFIEQQGWQDLQMVEGVSLLDVLGTLPKGGSRTKKPSSTRKYICPKCGNSCRATKAINIICGDCMDKMIVAE